MMADFQAETEANAQNLSGFERKLSACAPQPRTGFEGDLAERLEREYAQRRSARQPLVRVQPRRRSMRLVVVLAAVLIVGVGVAVAMSAYLRQFIDYDAGLKAIYEQGLGHEIGISQTADGFTVTLEWAYADGNRLTLAYVIQGLAGEQYTNLSSDTFDLILRDSGVEIPFLQGMSGAFIDQNGEFIGLRVPSDVIYTGDRSLLVLTYDLADVDVRDRTTLDLRLEVLPYGITPQQRTLLPIERFNDMKSGPDEPFIFDFSISLVDDQRVLRPALTATDQDITITLREVVVSPSQTRVVICFVSPDPARQWTGHPRLTTEQGDVPGGGGVQPFIDGEVTCDEYTYFAGMYDYTGEWQLEIMELIGFGSGGGADQERIQGSWRFAFVVP